MLFAIQRDLKLSFPFVQWVRKGSTPLTPNAIFIITIRSGHLHIGK